MRLWLIGNKLISAINVVIEKYIEKIVKRKIMTEKNTLLYSIEIFIVSYD